MIITARLIRHAACASSHTFDIMFLLRRTSRRRSIPILLNFIFAIFIIIAKRRRSASMPPAGNADTIMPLSLHYSNI